MIHDEALLGGKYQDFDRNLAPDINPGRDLELHANLLPFKAVGDFDALRNEVMAKSSYRGTRKSNAVIEMLAHVEGLVRGMQWEPRYEGVIDPLDPELVAIRAEHGQGAVDVIVRELQHSEAVHARSGGYTVIAAWDYDKDKRMDTHVAVKQLVCQYTRLRKSVQQLAGETPGRDTKLSEYELGEALGAEQRWVDTARERIAELERRTADAERRATEAERRVAHAGGFVDLTTPRN